jgi:uncharacterized protein with NRDE domain
VCLLIVASRVVPGWPLIVAANRDERFDRPAEALTVLRSEPPKTLGGRDLLAGGTWLAVNVHGVAAALTNQPNPDGRDLTKRSRGEIPLALTTARSAAAAVTAFEASCAPEAFNPCWVLVGDRSTLYYLDMTRPDQMRGVELPPGIHVLENKPLGEPSAKVDQVTKLLGDTRERTGDELLEVLRWVAADHTITHEPADDTERSLLVSKASACCVHSEEYGTRSSTLLREPRSRRHPPELWASDGPSCTHPLVRASF